MFFQNNGFSIVLPSSRTRSKIATNNLRDTDVGIIKQKLRDRVLTHECLQIEPTPIQLVI